MIALPDHGCCSGGALPYGPLDAANVATCSARRVWGGRDAPGCGARIAVCHGCGLRTRVNGARCPACGGEDRPEVVHVQHVEVPAKAEDQQRNQAMGPEGVAEVVAAHARADVPGQGGNGSRRETRPETKASPKRRAVKGKKGAVPVGDTSSGPLFK